MWPTFNKDEFCSLQEHENCDDGVTNIWEPATANEDKNHAAVLKAMSFIALSWADCYTPSPLPRTLGVGWNQSIYCPAKKACYSL